MADWKNADGRVKLLHGDCTIRMQDLQNNSIDAVVTDPPYGLAFMGKDWDDVSKIKLFHHKWAAAVLRVMKPGAHILSCGGTRTYHRMVVALEDIGLEIRDAILWIYGGGFPKGKNVLKPAVEPICLARKPLRERTIEKNVKMYGTGSLNIEESRIGDDDGGRWPANVVMDEEAAQMLDEQSGYSQSRRDVLTSKPGQIYGGGDGLPSYTGLYGFDDSGGASRFFYTAKASTAERRGSNHPTIKPLALMKYLVQLVTPPGGKVLDPFAGSGTTLEAAYQLGFNAVGIEMDAENLDTIIKRHEQMAMELL